MVFVMKLKSYLMFMVKLIKAFIVKLKYSVYSFILLDLFQELIFKHLNLLKLRLSILMLT